MGVLGLWQILESVGHPIKVEGLEGKRLGVDANVWLYKFIRGFREKETGTNLESHKLGLFNRVSKLLFYKIKPVFVFDGPAPTLKRRTLERRQNIRYKNLSKVQDAAMKVLAEQLKKQYPDADIDHVRIQLPEFRSNTLVAAEKLTDEDRDLFYLPPEQPTQEHNNKEEQDDEDDDFSDSEFDVKFVPYSHGRVDIESKDFDSLPPEIRYEILHDVKSKKKRIGNPEALPDDPNSFSSFQLKRLNARRSIQAKIEQCEREICNEVSPLVVQYEGQKEPEYDLRKREPSFIAEERSQPTSSSQSQSESQPDAPAAATTTEEPTFDDSDIFYIPPDSSDEEHVNKEKNDKITDKSDINIRFEGFKQSALNTHKIGEEPALTDEDSSSSSSSSSSSGTEFHEVLPVVEEPILDDSDIFFIPSEQVPKPKDHKDNEIINLADDSDINIMYERLNNEQVDIESKDSKCSTPEIQLEKPAPDAVLFTSISSSPEPIAEDEHIHDKQKSPSPIPQPKELELEKTEKPEQPIESQIEKPEVKIPSEKASSQPIGNQQEPDTVNKPEPKQSTGEENQSQPTSSSQTQYYGSQQSATAAGVSHSTQAASKRVTTKIIDEAKELLTLFGVPYIDAAGEAEAQCALLEELKLTEGTITDDSDVWLFGSQNVYRHFFSDDKYVLQYKLKDIEFHLRLTRENMVCFAMMVGSDYTDGIMNVGPVTALEVLSEFPGPGLEPLIKFKQWHNEQLALGVSKRRVGNKKRAKLLKYNIPGEFPSRAVFEGYLKPAADSSEEKFTWGMPDLDELRDYARRNFGWDQKRADDKLLPVMKKLSERRTQTTIDTFFFKTSANQNPEMFRSKRINEALTKLAKRDDDNNDDEVVCLSEDEDEADQAGGSSSQSQGKTTTTTTTRKTTKTTRGPAKKQQATTGRGAKTRTTTTTTTTSKKKNGGPTTTTATKRRKS